MLTNLTTDELLRHFENSRDPLTTSATEIELAVRLSDLADEADEHEGLIAVLKELEIDKPDELKAQLALAVAVKELLAQHDLADADALQDALGALADVRAAVAV